jgi:gluconokinase
MPASLLETQLAALEPPAPEEDALTVSIDAPVETVVERIAAALLPEGTIAEGRR